jgi:hypothetical protein
VAIAASGIVVSDNRFTLPCRHSLSRRSSGNGRDSARQEQAGASSTITLGDVPVRTTALYHSSGRVKRENLPPAGPVLSSGTWAEVTPALRGRRHVGPPKLAQTRQEPARPKMCPYGRLPPCAIKRVNQQDRQKYRLFLLNHPIVARRSQTRHGRHPTRQLAPDSRDLRKKGPRSSSVMASPGGSHGWMTAGPDGGGIGPFNGRDAVRQTVGWGTKAPSITACPPRLFVIGGTARRRVVGQCSITVGVTGLQGGQPNSLLSACPAVTSRSCSNRKKCHIRRCSPPTCHDLTRHISRRRTWLQRFCLRQSF